MSDEQPQWGTTPEGETPYSAYLQTEILHSVQRTVSGSSLEHAFLINAQIGELYWAMISNELKTAQAEFRKDNIHGANRVLYRIVCHLQAMNANWKSISWLTPVELMGILRGIGSTFGKDTSLQGWAFRQMAFLFGIKQRHQLEHFKPQPHRLKQLTEVLEGPSIYDDVLAALKRSGAAVPQSVLDRDFSENYVANPEVEAAWQAVYAKDDAADPWRTTAELLADIAVEFTNWKYLHLMATRRTLGGRPAYYGVNGVEWLLPTMDEIPFPELWSARSHAG